MSRRLIGVLLLGLFLFATAGCGPAEKDKTGKQKELPKWDEYKDKVQQSLFELVTAEEPSKQAEQRDLDYFQLAMVRVVLVLAPGASLPEGFMILQESRYEDDVQALVPVDKLLALSQQPEIQYIRAPVKPKTR